MTDAINVGLASDRLEAIGQLQDSRVINLAEGAVVEASDEILSEEAFLVQEGTIQDFPSD